MLRITNNLAASAMRRLFYLRFQSLKISIADRIAIPNKMAAPV